MIYMDTMAGPGLMGIVVPMGQRQQRKYKGVNPVTMNRYLSRFEALCNWYTSYKQRLHVHLGNREYRRLLLGTPQTPSYRKRTSFFIIMWRSLKWISGRSALRTPVWAFSFGLVRPVIISLPTLEAVRRRNRERLQIIRASISEHPWVHR